MRIRSILRELNVTKKQVIDYCKEEYPHLFHKQTYIPIRNWKPNIEESEGITIEFCEVKFKSLLLFYLSDHNVRVTGGFMSELKGW